MTYSYGVYCNGDSFDGDYIEQDYYDCYRDVPGPDLLLWCWHAKILVPLNYPREKPKSSLEEQKDEGKTGILRERIDY